MANVSDRTAHVKLTEKQWARLDKEEAREVERRRRRGDDTPVVGFKVQRIRQLVSRGLLFEKIERAKRRAADRLYLIEFRNGLFLGSPDGAPHSVPKDQAMRFTSEDAARAFAHRNQWIWANGGMIVEVTS